MKRPMPAVPACEGSRAERLAPAGLARSVHDPPQLCGELGVQILAHESLRGHRPENEGWTGRTGRLQADCRKRPSSPKLNSSGSLLRPHSSKQFHLLLLVGLCSCATALKCNMLTPTPCRSWRASSRTSQKCSGQGNCHLEAWP